MKSFNGRTGAVVPAAGDYTAAQVGALPSSGGNLTGPIYSTSSSVIQYGDASNASGGIGVCSNGLIIKNNSGTEGGTNSRDQLVFTNLALNGQRQVWINANSDVVSSTQAIRLSNIKTPVDDLDAANKSYVDSKAGGSLNPQSANMTQILLTTAWQTIGNAPDGTNYALVTFWSINYLGETFPAVQYTTPSAIAIVKKGSTQSLAMPSSVDGSTINAWISLSVAFESNGPFRAYSSSNNTPLVCSLQFF